MTTIRSSDYHDYVIKDGRFVGRFDEMYQNVDDPWGSVEGVHSLDNDLLLAVLKHVTPVPAMVLDVGSGLGALTARIRDMLPHAALFACDVSETAVAKAQKRYPGISFFVHDISHVESTPFPPASLHVIAMAQVMWYVLPSLDAILRGFFRLLRPAGHLVVLQSFLHPTDQKYGCGVVEDPGDFLRFVREAGFAIKREVYINRERPQNLLLWAAKPDETGAPAERARAEQSTAGQEHA